MPRVQEPNPNNVGEQAFGFRDHVSFSASFNDASDNEMVIDTQKRPAANVENLGLSSGFRFASSPEVSWSNVFGIVEDPDGSLHLPKKKPGRPRKYETTEEAEANRRPKRQFEGPVQPKTH